MNRTIKSNDRNAVIITTKWNTINKIINVAKEYRV